MTRQGPHVRDRWADFDSDPKRQPIAEGGADGTCDPDRPKSKITGADQNADADERRPRRNEQRNECQRLTESECKNNRRRPRLMDTHKLDQVVGVIFEVVEHARRWPGYWLGLARLARQGQTACDAGHVFRAANPSPNG